jgi:hypothetical protein
MTQYIEQQKQSIDIWTSASIPLELEINVFVFLFSISFDANYCCVTEIFVFAKTQQSTFDLDVNSAYYVAKTRSMREDPNPELDVSEKFYSVSSTVLCTPSCYFYSYVQLFDAMFT